MQVPEHVLRLLVCDVLIDRTVSILREEGYHFHAIRRAVTSHVTTLVNKTFAIYSMLNILRGLEVRHLPSCST